MSLPLEPPSSIPADTSAWTALKSVQTATVEPTVTAHGVSVEWDGHDGPDIGAPPKSTGDILEIRDSTGGYQSADVNLAVGLDQWLTVDSEWVVKFDGRRHNYLIWSFFDSILPSTRAIFTSTGALFSPEHERFVVAAMSYTLNRSQASLYLAISRTADVRGDWNYYRLDTDIPSSDRLSVAIDSFGLYVTTDGTDLDSQARIWTFSPSILDGGSGIASVLTPKWPDDESSVRSLQVAVPHTVSSEDATFFVATRPAGGNKMLALKLQGSRPTDLQVSQTLIDVPACFPIGEQVEQPDSELDFDGGDCAVADVVYAFRRLYAVWTHDASETGSRSGLQTVRVSTDTGNLLSTHFLDNGPGRRWYYFNPALTVLGGDDQDLTIGLFFNYTQRDFRYVSAGAQIFGEDGVDRFVNLYRGNQPWTDGDSAGRLRWARSSGAAYDWHETGVMWGVTQVVAGYQRKLYVFKVAMDDAPHPVSTACIKEGSNACLLSQRFDVRIRWKNSSGASGLAAPVIPGTDNSSNFWFFEPNNWEMLTKVLDGCAINGHYWFFAAATTDVGYQIIVTDTHNGNHVVYNNSVGTAAAAITDTAALPCE